MTHSRWLGLGLLLCIMHGPAWAVEVTSDVPKVPWGKIVPGPAGLGVFTLEIDTWPEGGKLTLPAAFAHITRAYLAEDRERKPLLLEFSADGSSLVLHLPEKKPQDGASEVRLETADKSTQFADGRIVLSVADATISVFGGLKPISKLESQPGHHRINFGKTLEESAVWEYAATRPGMYDVEVTYANDDAKDADLEFRIGESKLTATRGNTGSMDTYTTTTHGRVYLPAAGKFTATSYCKTLAGGPAKVSLKAVTLRPTCEGKPPTEDADGTIVCHARDVTIQGVKVQYEPKPEKNTVGYWVNEKDWVYWDFTAQQSGTYEVEILQGCGTGHGGSEVKLSIAGQDLPFTVEDTGHFQNFKPRTIGTVKLTPSEQRLTVVPVKKANVAVMDLRQVRLIPVKTEEKK